MGGCVRSFVIAGRGPAQSVSPSAETFISVQCASPGRGGELVGVSGVRMRALYMVEAGTVGVSSLSGISKSAPSRRGLLSL